MNGENIEFTMEPHGGVRLDFEHENLQLTMDAAYELQYRLAEFLSAVELGGFDHLGSVVPTAEDGGVLCEAHSEMNRHALDALAGFRRPRRMH